VPNGFEYGLLSLPLDVALSNACTAPVDAEDAIAQFAKVAPVDLVFIGAHSLPTPTDNWSLPCIAKLSNLRLVTSAQSNGSTAAAFAVIK
jgi:hypothetical protein